MLIAFDIGQRRIGVATADEELRIATASHVIHLPRGSSRDAILGAVIDAVQNCEEPVSRIVIGRPTLGRTKTTVMETLVTELATSLKQQFNNIVLWDESFSSQIATLARQAVGKKNEPIDAHAAAIILQGYLDYHVSS